MKAIHIMDLYAMAREYITDHLHYTDFSLTYTQTSDRSTYVEYEALDMYERMVTLFAFISEDDGSIRSGVRITRGHYKDYFDKLLHEDRSWTVPTRSSTTKGKSNLSSQKDTRKKAKELRVKE